MELNNKTVQKQSKTPISSIVMYIFSGIIGLIGIANIYSNVTSFNATVKQYVSQGYTAAEVYKAFSPQLIQGILQSIGTYFGIAFVLICAAIINNKLSKCLNTLSKDESVCPTEFVEQAVPVEEVQADSNTQPVDDESVQAPKEEQ
jgi:predicted transporter